MTDYNLFETTDYQYYKDEFLALFGFGIEGVDYDADANPIVDFTPITLD